MDTKGNIGRRIREARTRLGLNQFDVEQKAGLYRNYLSQLENGHKAPRTETLEKIANALGVRMSELIEAPNATPAPLPSWVIIAGRRVEQSSPVYETASILLELPAAQQELVLNMVKGLRTQKNSNPGVAAESVA